jgi:phosphoribosylaminoimidazole (AIR) synthetase
MFRVFNMGIGFCAVVSEEDAGTFEEIVRSHGREALQIGRVVSDPQQRVVIRPYGLVGKGSAFFNA